MREESKKPSRFLGKTGFIVIIIECSWLWLHCDLFAEKESTLLATAVSVSVSIWYDSITYIIHSTHTLEYASENERVTSLFLQYLNYFFLSRWVELSQVQSEWKNQKIKSEREWKTFESIRASVHMLSSECVSFYQYVRCLINWIPMFAFEISICIAHTSHTRLNYYRNKIRFLVNFLKALRHATFVCNDSTSLKVIIYCSMYVFWLQTCNQVNCSMHRNLWIEWEFLVFLLSHVLLSSAYQNYMVQLPTMMWDTLITKNS